MARVTESEHNASIRAHLDQSEFYPSESKGRVRISEMDPVHAFNAWRRLRMLTYAAWGSAKHRPLAVALYEQATDEHWPRSHPTLTLEQVFDALAKADTITPTDGKPVHPITRARVVLEELTKENHG